MAPDDQSAIVVVEQESKAAMAAEMAAEAPPRAPAVDTSAEATSESGINRSLEDTFSSDTAINLDQSDPIAEADFHMAYGLHDQAADLLNGALEVEPERLDLLAKLCEVYFVWGNRDAFVDAAQKMKAVVGDAANAEWDKIIIMGQQIAGEHEIFSGKTAAAATQAVDLSFDDGAEDIAALDMDLDLAGGLDGEVSDIIDLGSDSAEPGLADASGIDFVFEDADTSASVTQEMHTPDATIDAPLGDEAPVELSDTLSDSESTVETPTIEEQFESFGETAEVKALAGADDGEATELASLDELPSTDATAEIDLDELGLDLDALVATGLEPGFEEDAATEETGFNSDTEQTGESQAPRFEDLDATGESEVPGFEDLEASGKNLAVDAEDQLAATGTNTGMDATDASDLPGPFDLASVDDIGDALQVSGEAETEAVDDGGAQTGSDEDFGVDTSLLDATGQTQILSEDFVVETAGKLDKDISSEAGDIPESERDDAEAVGPLSDDVETMLAPLDEDDPASTPDDEATMLAPVDDEFEFAKTEALPVDIFADDPSSDETGELPALAGSTDLDLDLDDLTAALKVSEVGDTINQPFDDKTVEQPRVRPDADLDFDVGESAAGSAAETQALAPDDLSDDLNDARTMTEVGTKLDLARAYVDMGDPSGARGILEEVLDEGDESQRQQAQQLLDSLPS